MSFKITQDLESVAAVQDTESLSALQEYVAALSHPETGIPCQVRTCKHLQIHNYVFRC